MIHFTVPFLKAEFSESNITNQLIKLGTLFAEIRCVILLLAYSIFFFDMPFDLDLLPAWGH